MRSHRIQSTHRIPYGQRNPSIGPPAYLRRREDSKKLRSCFKFIPRQIETYVEADWSPRYAVNSGLLTKIKGF